MTEVAALQSVARDNIVRQSQLAAAAAPPPTTPTFSPSLPHPPPPPPPQVQPQQQPFSGNPLYSTTITTFANNHQSLPLQFDFANLNNVGSVGDNNTNHNSNNFNMEQFINGLYSGNAAAGPSNSHMSSHVAPAPAAPVAGGQCASNAIDVDMLDSLATGMDILLPSHVRPGVWDLTDDIDNGSMVPTPTATNTPTPPVETPRELSPLAVSNPFQSLGNPVNPRKRNVPSPVCVVKAPLVKKPLAPLATEMAIKAAAPKMNSSSISLITREAPAAPEPKKIALAPKGNNIYDEIMKAVQPQALVLNKPGQLFKHLRRREQEDGTMAANFTPTPTQLARILTALNFASNSYLRTMADNEDYTETIRRWLKQFNTNPTEWEPAIAPLFFVLARTDMALNWIKEFKIGKLVINVYAKAEELKLAAFGDIKKAYEAYVKYVKNVLQPKKREIHDDSDSESDTGHDAKRRKTTTPSSKPSSSKLVTSSKPVAPSGRTDMSFFSAPAKPKAKMPDFKKGPLPPPAPVSSAKSLLASTMKMLKKDDSPPPPPPRAVESNPAFKVELKVDVKPAKLNKKGHTVRWVDNVPSGRELVAVRLFREELHEFERPYWQEPEDGVHGLSSRQLDMDEGRHMHHHADDADDPMDYQPTDGIEEAREWYEPVEYEGAKPLLPAPTEETTAQAQRESTISETMYLIGDIPPSAAEGTVRIVRADGNTAQMNRTPIYGVAPAAAAAPVAPMPNVDVSALLNNLKNIPTPVAQQPAYGDAYGHPQTGYNPGYQSPLQGQPPPPQVYGQGQNQWGGAPNQHQQPGYTGYNPHANNNQGHNIHQNKNKNKNKNKNNNNNQWRPGGFQTGGAKPPGFKSKECRYWRSGSCHAGQHCTYAHSNVG